MAIAKVGSEAVQQSEPEPAVPAGPAVLVVDVRRRQKKRRIKQLRKGRGRLMEKVHEMVEDLRREGAIQGEVQPIVLVVRQKDRSGFRL